jgi:hypothetical protein
MTKPDFIIIGAMKSATSTLHTQLSLQPDIFMSTPKEPNFFSDDDVYKRGARWYMSLFSLTPKGHLCGESSTHYTKLPDYPLTIGRMSKLLKETKFIYIMRHPIDRLVSHYIHQWSQNIIKCDINEAINKHPELINYSKYSMQLQPYFDEFGINNVLPLFAEKFKKSPQKQLDLISNFIDYHDVMHWNFNLKQQNISKERIRHFRGYKFFVDSNVMVFLRRRLIPQFFRTRIKKKLTIKNRPTINEIQLKRLTEIFNEDLKQLGTWLGIDLSCENYKEKIINNDLMWGGIKQAKN